MFGLTNYFLFSTSIQPRLRLTFAWRGHFHAFVRPPILAHSGARDSCPTNRLCLSMNNTLSIGSAHEPLVRLPDHVLVTNLGNTTQIIRWRSRNHLKVQLKNAVGRTTHTMWFLIKMGIPISGNGAQGRKEGKDLLRSLFACTIKANPFLASSPEPIVHPCST